jgi:hypothetical protein
VTPASVSHEDRSLELVDRWFRHLDQRRIYQGLREWRVQVTSILLEEDVIWIQIADDSRWCGSVLLRVRDTASIDQAVGALSLRTTDSSASYPKVISVPVNPRVA